MGATVSARSWLVAVAAALSAVLVGCGSGGAGGGGPAPTPERGDLVSSQFLRTVTRLESTVAFNTLGIPLPANLRDVRCYKVLYRTPGVSGALTTASGLVALPVGGAGALGIFSYQHATIYDKSQVPSRLVNEGLGPAAVAGGSGYVVVAADYLGLGDSPGLHPYVHAATEASACLDLLRAARTVCANQSVTLSGTVLLGGYSQGGHATMALHRALDSEAAGEFTVAAAAPGAGPYDLSETTLQGALTSPGDSTAQQMLYLLTAYQMVYQPLADPSEALVAPYDQLARDVLAGTRTMAAAVGQIAAGVTPQDMLQPAYYSRLRTNPGAEPMVQRLAQNNVYDWAPRAPVTLYHGTADTEVLYHNSEVAFAAMTARGATVQLVPLAGLDHEAAAQVALVQAFAWLQTQARHRGEDRLWPWPSNGSGGA